MVLRGGLRVALAVLVVVIGACTQPEEFSRQPGTVVQEGGQPVQRGSGGSGGAGEKRVALVVGNNAYEHIGVLSNPVNDARDIAEVLEGLGFRVTKLEDASHEEFRSALKGFAERSEKAGIGLIFYAGHGLEMDGVNYLLPVDAKLSRDTDLMHDGLQLREDVLGSMSGDGLHLVILDACRNLPAIRRMKRTRSGSVSNGGFGALQTSRLGRETLVAYAAAAGKLADDGEEGQRNSPYTAALKEQLLRQQDLRDVFQEVRKQVAATTEEAQVPHEYSSLREKYYLAGEPEGPASGVGTSDSVSGMDVVDRQTELRYWESAERGGRGEDYEDYLRRYPEGEFADFARRRLESLGGGAGESSVGGGSAGSAGGSSDPERRDLEGDRALWEEIRESRDPEDYAAYVRAYPGGIYVELAQRRLGQYREEEAWRVATAGNRLEGFMGYLREYPEGRHAEGARGRVRELADARAVEGETGLQWAADNNLEGVARELLAAGVAVDVKDKYGDTPLHDAASNNAEEVARELLGAGAAVDAKDKDGRTPLHMAAWNNAEEVARELLGAGAAVDAKDKYGQTPLHMAAWSNAEGVVRELLGAGAAVDAKDKDGETPLHSAAMKDAEDAMRVLLEHGASRGEVGEKYRGRLP